MNFTLMSLNLMTASDGTICELLNTNKMQQAQHNKTVPCHCQGISSLRFHSTQAVKDKHKGCSD